MPRKARIDAAGALHHIIVRGIERRKIFWDDEDRDSFLKRLGQVLPETQTDCFAWALIPNPTCCCARALRRSLTITRGEKIAKEKGLKLMG
jgi:hypothetical protein